jgi:hypothetical protein
MRALVPLVFQKGGELKERWMGIIGDNKEGARIDVCRWISRATFDVIGLAGAFFTLTLEAGWPMCIGFDYHFNAIESESNELFNAYKMMFDVAMPASQWFRGVVAIYFPIIDSLFVSL